MRLTLSDLHELKKQTDKISPKKYNYTNLLLLLNNEIESFFKESNDDIFEIRIFNGFICFLEKEGKLSGALLSPKKENQISYRISGILKEIFGNDEKIRRTTLTRRRSKRIRYNYWENSGKAEKKQINNDLVYLFNDGRAFVKDEKWCQYGVGISLEHNNVFCKDNTITVSVSEKTVTHDGYSKNEEKEVTYSNNMSFEELQKFLREVSKLNKETSHNNPIQNFLIVFNNFYGGEKFEGRSKCSKNEAGIFKEKVINKIVSHEEDLTNELNLIMRTINDKEYTPEIKEIEEDIKKLQQKLVEKRKEAKGLTFCEREKEKNIRCKLKNIRLAKEEVKNWSYGLELKMKNEEEDINKIIKIYGV